MSAARRDGRRSVTETAGEAGRPPRRRRQQEPLIPAGPVRASANVCQAAGCLSMGSDRLFDAVRDGVVAAGLEDVAVRRVGCLGLCAAGPLVAVPEQGRLFERCQADDPASVDGLLAEPGRCGAGRARRWRTTPSFPTRSRWCWSIAARVDPESLEDYVAGGGYEALRQGGDDDDARRRRRRGRPQRAAGPRRGGLPHRPQMADGGQGVGGPEGKFVVCNADEGDPGAFMDRSVLESCPQQVLEGMAIAGYAVGANRGFVYVRAEYPLAVKRLSSAIRQAEHAGYLGRDIAGTRFDFQVEVRIGAGAFVCGEETALIASIQGGRGTPRPRPPYPAASGLWGAPTLINNVETFANIPSIVTRGGEWLSSIGTEQSKGTKVFALAGAVANTGLIEVPMGLHPAPDRVRDRRRAGRGQEVQGGPDRWPVRGLHTRSSCSTCPSTTRPCRRRGR